MFADYIERALAGRPFDMRKFAIAATVGVMLLAGQAVAANQAASSLQVGDRVGRVEGSSKAMFGDAIPDFVVYGGLAILGFTAWAITNDSDKSTSP